MIKFLVKLFVCILIIHGISYSQTSIDVEPKIDFWSDIPDEILARKLVNKMTNEELLGQIFMFGWSGSTPTKLLYSWVTEKGLGSVKVFGWNTENIYLVAKSVTSLQSKAMSGPYKIPLFVATDQEGGWIRHVKGETSITPGNMAVGASGYPADAWYTGYYIAREIKALGINMNFAPVVDLYNNKDSTIISTRSFGEDARKVGILGSAFASGSLQGGVIPTAKHFPGHGDTSLDSHVNLPVIKVDFETFKNRELVPFEYLINAQVPCIMSGHLSFPRIEKDGRPASLSSYFITELLKTQLGFKGVVITDDMMMNGDTLYAGSLSKAFKMAIEAGNDIIMSSSTPTLNDNLYINNLALMTTDSSFKERVKDACYNVLRLKLKYFKGASPAPLYPNADTLSDFIPDKEGQKFFLEQACRSITIYKETSIPLKSDTSGRILLCGSLSSFFEEGKKRYKGSGEFKFNYDLNAENYSSTLEAFKKAIKNYDTIIMCIHNERSSKLLKEIRNANKKVVVLSIMDPNYCLDMDFASDILIGYSYSPYTFEAMLGALNGEYKVQGTLPFTKS